MTRTLYNRVYEVVRDADGFPVVIYRQSRLIWRVASPEAALRVLAGLITPPIRSAA